MISRTWHGIVPIHMKDAFEKYEYETGIRDTTIIKGNPDDAQFGLISDPIVILQEVADAKNPFL